MSRRKLSFDEKCEEILQIFHQQQTFFQLKEIEKIALKDKGIPEQAVKELLTKLLDDGFIESDKIGQSIYYWSFPSIRLHKQQQNLDKINEKVKAVASELQIVDKEITNLQIGREVTPERQSLLQQIIEMDLQRDDINKKLEQYKDRDPKMLEKLRNDIDNIKDAANRWTDNTFNLKKWCWEKFCIEKTVFDKQFGIPDNFDYIE